MPFGVSSQTRGAQSKRATIAATGTITQLGTALTGSGTLFTSQCAVGDQIIGTGISGRVVSITNGLLLVLDNSLTVAVPTTFTVGP